MGMLIYNAPIPTITDPNNIKATNVPYAAPIPAKTFPGMNITEIKDKINAITIRELRPRNPKNRLPSNINANTKMNTAIRMKPTIGPSTEYPKNPKVPNHKTLFQISIPETGVEVEVHATNKLVSPANTPIPLFFKFIFEEVNFWGF